MRRYLLSLLVCTCFATLLTAEEPTGELADKLKGVTFEQYSTAPGYSEGPTWRNGEVLFCSGALMRVDNKRELHKFLEINPAGTYLNGNEGHVLIADNKTKAILELQPNNEVHVLAELYDNQTLRGLNDLTVDAAGNIYWTDPEGSSLDKPIGNLYRLNKAGRVDLIAGGLAFPNGLEVDPASKFLYVIESQSKKILRYGLVADHRQLGKPEVFYDLGGSGGDGCAFDAAGNLWVTDFHRPETGKGRITVLSPEAKVLAYLPLPSKVVSNITFGGENRDEIFCTTGDPPGVFRAKVGVKGFAGHVARKHVPVRKLNVVSIDPKPDSGVVSKLDKLFAAAKIDGGKLNDNTIESAFEMVALIGNPGRQDEINKILPAWKKNVLQQASDRELLAEVKRLGGKVTSEVVAPDWLRSLAGDEALTTFSRIVEIDWNERTDGHKEPTPKKITDRVNDDTLKLLAGQDHLRSLQLSGTAVTSAGLVHLKDLKSLERLNVCLTNCTDEGFEQLAGLTNMKRMTVCASKITGSGFQHLGGMKQLESINLHSSPASDDGLAAIGKLPSLRRLEIVHTHVTDAGLAHLVSLEHLRQLHIHGPQTTEAALPFVGKLTRLYELDVYDRAASDATCAQIAKLPKLRKLMLVTGVFTDAGVRELASMTTLENVTLDSAHMTDASLEALAKLPNLRTLSLNRGKFSAEAKETFAKKLPEVVVKF
ncbi:SMP-30/gluconolactonase/LRE family protein [Anatilimnocola floriformis]|uniref:SMP-30/gluconolactonase/LRE family protein n=1 Tax=Anatilimnocola floriformis TaxID=2948575 RepID=UPI0020C3AD78|nr:SMP-30/gluconolactonase/LRE family protein [Anatilimnocola floriformis]